jgi:hypothetical protein
MPVLHQNKRDFIEFFMGFLVMKPLGMSDTILLWPFIVDLPIKHGDFPYFFVSLPEGYFLGSLMMDPMGIYGIFAGVLLYHWSVLGFGGPRFTTDKKLRWSNIDIA